jgi:hypothetical protein
MLGFALIIAAALVVLYIQGVRCDHRNHLRMMREAADKKKAGQA